MRCDHDVIGAGPIVLPAPAVDNPGAIDALSGLDQHGSTTPKTMHQASEATPPLSLPGQANYPSFGGEATDISRQRTMNGRRLYRANLHGSLGFRSAGRTRHSLHPSRARFC